MRLVALLSALMMGHVSATQCQAATAMGCLTDLYQTPAGKSLRVLNSTAIMPKGAKLTRESCIAACCKAGYKEGSLSGTENGVDCYCDSSFGPYTIPQDKTGCSTACAGAENETCGGKDRIDVYTITQCPHTVTPRADDRHCVW